MKPIILDLKTLKKIYRTRMKEDFDKNELKPFRAIKKLIKSGDYLPLGFEEDGEILAYALFVTPKDCDTALFDYFAVEEHHRNGGIGSKCLAFLPEYLGDYRITIFECDHPDFARGDEKTKREHRIGFYKRNGVRESNVHSSMFGADFRLLYMSDETFSDDEIRAFARKIYAFIFPKPILKRFIRVYDK